MEIPGFFEHRESRTSIFMENGIVFVKIAVHIGKIVPLFSYGLEKRLDFLPGGMFAELAFMGIGKQGLVTEKDIRVAIEQLAQP